LEVAQGVLAATSLREDVVNGEVVSDPTELALPPVAVVDGATERRSDAPMLLTVPTFPTPL